MLLLIATYLLKEEDVMDAEWMQRLKRCSARSRVQETFAVFAVIEYSMVSKRT